MCEIYQRMNCKNIQFISSVLLVTIFITCCKKSSQGSELPDITQTGKNTFGCRINESIWIPNQKCDFFTDPCIALDVSVLKAYPDSSLPLGLDMLFGSKVDGGNTFMTMISRNIQAPPYSYIFKTGNIFDSLGIMYVTANAYAYYSRPNFGGSVELTKIDTTAKILSGIFAFTLYGSNGDSVVVTDGRFDLKFFVCKCK
jgi:hypothetical protein